jgi:hypothetical protein
MDKYPDRPSLLTGATQIVTVLVKLLTEMYVVERGAKTVLLEAIADRSSSKSSVL